MGLFAWFLLNTAIGDNFDCVLKKGKAKKQMYWQKLGLAVVLRISTLIYILEMRIPLVISLYFSKLK